MYGMQEVYIYRKSCTMNLVMVKSPHPYNVEKFNLKGVPKKSYQSKKMPRNDPIKKKEHCIPQYSNNMGTPNHKI